jgi:hypothetical protein
MKRRDFLIAFTVTSMIPLLTFCSPKEPGDKKIMTDESKPIADILSRLPMLDYETAEKWLAGKAGVVQVAADIALESQCPPHMDAHDPAVIQEFIEDMKESGETDDDFIEKVASSMAVPHTWDHTPDIRFCEGDLIVDDLPITCDCLIVAGNLKVRGLMQTAMEAEEGALIVLGNTEVGRYVSHGAHTVICGNLHAGHVSTNSLNDLSFNVGGNVEAESFAEFGEYVEIHGNLKVGKLINWMNEINVHGERKAKVLIDGDTPLADLKALLRAELIGESVDTDGTAYILIHDDAYEAHLERNVSPFL